MTPKDHADRLQLQIALTELDTLTHRLNETKRDSENRLEARRLLSQMSSRLSFKVEQRDVFMVRHDDIVEVVSIIVFSYLFMPLPNIACPEEYCFCPVCPCVRACVQKHC